MQLEASFTVSNDPCVQEAKRRGSWEALARSVLHTQVALCRAGQAAFVTA